MADAPVSKMDVDVALAQCAEEPIHIPGAIQPHGVLLALEPASYRIVAATANAAAFLSADELIGRTLMDVLGDAAASQVRAMALQGEHFDERSVGYVTLPDGTLCEAVQHESGGLTLLELMPEPAGLDVSLEALQVQAALERLLQATGTDDLLQVAAREVRTLTGFDRVDLYRFDPDWNGQVVAEAREGHMPAYLDLYFPASDIPPQARALYMRNRTRLIPDATYTPSRLEPDRNPHTHAPIDLSLSVLRSVSPVHLEYLANMDVQASMSVSVLREGQLWGLFACHHAQPRRVPFRVQAACGLLAQVLGMLLDRQRATEDERANSERGRLTNAVLEGLLRSENVFDGLAACAETLQELLDAGGVAVCSDAEVRTFGQTPAPEQIEALARWIGAQPNTDVFATNTLGRVYTAGRDFAEVASGVLAITLARRRGHTILWFRPERPQEVSWAGAASKGLSRDDEGRMRLHPRKSFDLWKTLLRGQARPWLDAEWDAAARLREVILDLVYERMETIQRLNTRLRRANETLEVRNRELQDFAFVASHDLREPLRKIRAFSDLLRMEHGAELPEGASAYVERVEAASIRAMQLVDDLLMLSRVGTRGSAFAPVQLGAVLDGVRHDLELTVDETDAQIEGPDTWPALQADAAQVAQVLRLLIENALKFRAPGRAPHVTVETDTVPAEDPHDPPRVILRVRDNGIGFESRFAERIFKPFERLHPRTEYPGTGMGLAIVRRIAERHGGRVRARSVLGEGTTFEVELPAWHERTATPDA